MPPIEGWKRSSRLEERFNLPAVWYNETVNQVAWLSNKVPDDGYYGFVASWSEVDDRNFAAGNRVAYSPARNDAYSEIVEWLRDNPGGAFL